MTCPAVLLFTAGRWLGVRLDLKALRDLHGVFEFACCIAAGSCKQVPSGPDCRGNDNSASFKYCYARLAIMIADQLADTVGRRVFELHTCDPVRLCYVALSDASLGASAEGIL